MLGACAGNGVSLDASGDSTTTTGSAGPMSLPVTYDDGYMRFDPPDGLAPQRTESEVRQATHAAYGSTVVFALFTTWSTGRMRDDGGIDPSHLRQPVWMIRTPDVAQSDDGMSGGAYAGSVPSTSQQTPTTVRHVDMLTVIDDATGTSLLTRTDRPDRAAVPWTDGPPKPKRATSCPADVSRYGPAGLIDDDGTPIPLSTIKVTRPRAVVRSANGDMYQIWGGEGSVEHEASATNADGDGVVIVSHYPADPCRATDPHSGEVTFHHEPSRSGIVTLTAIDGTRIRYRTAGGVTGTYDVVTEAFAQ